MSYYSDDKAEQIEREKNAPLLGDNAEEYMSVIDKYYSHLQEYPHALASALQTAIYTPNCFHAVYETILKKDFILQTIKTHFLDQPDVLEAFFLEDTTQLETIVNAIKGNLIKDSTRVKVIPVQSLLLLYEYEALSWEENEYVYEYCMNEYSKIFNKNTLEMHKQAFTELCKASYACKSSYACKASYAVRSGHPKKDSKTYNVDLVEQLITSCKDTAV